QGDRQRADVLDQGDDLRLLDHRGYRRALRSPRAPREPLMQAQAEFRAEGQQCKRCATPLEDGDIRCAVCALATPDHGRAPTRAVARVLRCTECGAAVAYVAEVQAPRCGFCRAVMRVETPTDPIEHTELY